MSEVVTVFDVGCQTFTFLTMVHDMNKLVDKEFIHKCICSCKACLTKDIHFFKIHFHVE